MELQSNEELKLANEFIESTGKNIFLTGKAGTGKTTFLKNLRISLSKRMIIVAPTGVAAINAGGVTIHSFFQLPFGPILPKGLGSSSNQSSIENSKLYRFSKEKINIIKSLDLLVIDEVSMVRADLLDGIDGVLRRFRNTSKPFGGVQLLMIGDLQQLAPIAKDDEWEILRTIYDSVFFFSSKALQSSGYVSIELKEIFRQSDKDFISLLNEVRNNTLSDQSIKLLNSRFLPDFRPNDSDGYITLTTHNNQAQSINASKLNELKSQPISFSATIEGDFPEHAFPTDSKLTLKEGAQVMFVKNDPSYTKQFYNGKIGTVVSIDDDLIQVKCPNEDLIIDVVPLEWANTKYSINPDTKDINEEVVGTFTQYPLKLAWAITIHKSQGLTFEKAIIDAQAAFAHGQVYVALSRCRSLEGIVLSSSIRPNSIINDSVVRGFNKDIEENQPNYELLNEAKLEYQKELLKELFSFTDYSKQFGSALYYVKQNTSSFRPTLVSELVEISESINKDLVEISSKFTAQIDKILEGNNSIENNNELNERVIKAIKYFINIIDHSAIPLIEGVNIDSDSKEHRNKQKEYIENISNELTRKSICLKSCEDGFNISKYIHARAISSIEISKRKSSKGKAKETKSTSQNQDIYNKLKEWRNKISKAKGIPAYRIIKQSTLLQIADEMPYTKSMLKEIKGIGKKKIEDYGDEIIEMILSYRAFKGFSIDRIDPVYQTTANKPVKTKSHEISYQLFTQGKSIKQIAAERELSEPTVAHHLEEYIESGAIAIESLVSLEKIESITEYFLHANDYRLGPAKDVLGDDYTYTEIKWVLKYLKGSEKLNDFEDEQHWL